MPDSDDSLLLRNQLCFPLYAASKALVRRYEPLLKPLGLTYTQYIVMMVLWERKEITVNELGSQVCLDSGTLSPLVDKLVSKGFVEKIKLDDGRYRLLRLTPRGEDLKQQCATIPAQIGSCLHLTPEEAQCLYKLCYKTLEAMEHES